MNHNELEIFHARRQQFATVISEDRPCSWSSYLLDLEREGIERRVAFKNRKSSKVKGGKEGRDELISERVQGISILPNDIIFA